MLSDTCLLYLIIYTWSATYLWNSQIFVVRGQIFTEITHHLHFESTAQPVVVGDKERIEQVLINLLNNAVKYSPNADRVIVRVSAGQEQATVSVQDFGKGIAEAHQQKIFERSMNHARENNTLPDMRRGKFGNRHRTRG